jgi:hypothetical protein
MHDKACAATATGQDLHAAGVINTTHLLSMFMCVQALLMYPVQCWFVRVMFAAID